MGVDLLKIPQLVNGVETSLSYKSDRATLVTGISNLRARLQ